MELSQRVPGDQEKGKGHRPTPKIEPLHNVETYNTIIIGLDVLWEEADAGNLEAEEVLRRICEQTIQAGGQLGYEFSRKGRLKMTSTTRKSESLNA